MKTHYLKKPKKCPRCNSLKIAKILWGMPNMDEELRHALNTGEIILGGCCISEYNPEWQCVDCETKLFIKERGHLEYLRRPRKCPACLSVNITTEITEQVNLNRELVNDIANKLDDRLNGLGEANHEAENRISKLYEVCSTFAIESENTQEKESAKRYGWNCKVSNLPTYKITD